jgi:stage II sporulation protein AA (anti-sigma F factor antagonist)
MRGGVFLLIAANKENDTIVAQIGGELDHHTAALVKNKLDDMLNDQNIKNIIIDVSNLSFMDSSGIGLFIGRYKTVSFRGGQLAVTGIKTNLHKVFEVSGLYRIVRAYDTVPEALEDIRGC